MIKKITMAALALCVIPGTLLAQGDKTKDKAQRQIITITRTGDDTQKTVIEIEGDKVKINGKDAADLKDVRVSVRDLKGSGAIAFGNGNSNAFRLDFNNDFKNGNASIFKVDSNRAMLGVVTDDGEQGAKIQTVSKESAAEKAGLKSGDVITKIDNRKIDNAADITDAVRAHKPGDKINITYLRGGKEQKATAELSRWKGVNIIKTLSAPSGVFNNQLFRSQLNDRITQIPGTQDRTFYTAPNRPKLGMSIQDTDDGKGVKVLDVDDEGTAGKAGVKEGDIITKVDDKDVNSADDVARFIREKKDQTPIRMQINRNGKTENIEVKFPKKIKTVDL